MRSLARPWGWTIAGKRLGRALRQRQFKVASDPRKRMEIAHRIVGAKLRTLGLHPADAAAFRAELARCRTILDFMAAEARAGLCYFTRWHGVGMKFKDAAPDHWRIFITRAAPPLKG
jgi:CRISPR/Cas system-associated endonuclease Cas1